MITITTPSRLDEATNDNTPAAVESATRVPTTGEPIAADVDGLPVSAPRTVDTARDVVNTRRPARELLYVSLASGLVISQLSSQSHPPVEYDGSTSRPDDLDRVNRTRLLICDPWMSPEANGALAEECVRRMASGNAARYVPIRVAAQLLITLDVERSKPKAVR